MQKTLYRTWNAVAAGAWVAACACVFPGVAQAGPLTLPAESPNADAAASDYLLILVLGGLGLLALIVGVASGFRQNKSDTATPTTNFQRNVAAGAIVAVAVIATFSLVQYDDAYKPVSSDQTGFQAEPVSGPKVYPASFSSPRDLTAPKGNHLVVDVSGQRYLWRYSYRNAGESRVFSYHDLVVPVNTTVVLNITSSDVTHSWWVPALGGKYDAVPNYVNKAWFKASRVGTFGGSCAELCGSNHAEMTTRVYVLPVDKFKNYIAAQADAIKSDSEALRQSLLLQKLTAPAGPDAAPAQGAN